MGIRNSLSLIIVYKGIKVNGDIKTKVGRINKHRSNNISVGSLYKDWRVTMYDIGKPLIVITSIVIIAAITWLIAHLKE
jgi:hypothetical protein